jgi:hypothetical protein
MPRRKNKNKQLARRGRDRNLRIISELLPEPDVDKIARALVSLAQQQAEKELAELMPPEAPKNDPFICDCMCNCCQLRRLHDGLCPQPSDDVLEELRRSA